MSHTQHLSEQELLRRNKLAEIEKLGIDPYPAPTYEINASAKEILENYPHLTTEQVKAALQYAADVIAFEETITT